MSENEIEVPEDYTREELRQDLLCYTSPVLKEDLVLTGDMTAELYISSDAPDTDFVVRVTDVDENGRSIKLADGLLSARYRNGFARSEFLQEGEIVCLKIRTTKEFGESTVSKILDLVENSSMKKARAENFITRFARVYTPAVCYGALALAFIPPIVLLLMGQPARFGDWVYRALTFLVISCPCALVISIPLSFFGGIGGASACGILVKGSTYLEELARTGIVVFDKTGTLTQGTFKVTGIHPAEGISEEQLVEAAALAESWSKHPISLSIKAAYGREIDPNRVTDVQELGGHGVTPRWTAGPLLPARPPDGKAGPEGSRRQRDRHHRACGHRGHVRRLSADRRCGKAPQRTGHPGPEGCRCAQDRDADRRCRAGCKGRFRRAWAG
mgnify:CR=1 FL=1